MMSDAIVDALDNDEVEKETEELKQELMISYSQKEESKQREKY